MTASPDGRSIAYLTRPKCRIYPVCPTVCSSWGYGHLPNVLAVLDIGTRKSVRTATPDPENPFFGIFFSHDSRRILTTYYGPSAEIAMVLDAAHPSFNKATRIPAPKHCQLIALAWSGDSILSAEGCGSGPADLNETAMLDTHVTGRILHSWPLPACINGLDALTSPDGRDVLVNPHINNGDGDCATHATMSDLMTLHNDSLRTVIRIPSSVGWDGSHLVAY